MRTVRTKGSTPDAIRKVVVANLLGHDLKAASQFDQACKQSVNLAAKNTANFKSKDLAMLQVCDLAKQYGVKVELV